MFFKEKSQGLEKIKIRGNAVIWHIKIGKRESVKCLKSFWKTFQWRIHR